MSTSCLRNYIVSVLWVSYLQFGGTFTISQHYPHGASPVPLPYVITWWDNNESGEMESFTLLVKPRSGFTNKLKMLPSTRYRAWIDGPYGPDRDLGTPISDYGHIFMVATGIGIGAQIPYIKQLLEGYRRGVVRTQKIVLIWQMDLEGEYEDYKWLGIWY